MADFQLSISYVLGNEGGYVNKSLDRGGPTNFGITQMTLSDWLKRPVSAEEVKSMTNDEAKEIYLHTRWLPLMCGRYPFQGMATCVLDASVLFGLSASVKFVQRAMNMMGEQLVVDGKMGSSTFNALSVKGNRDFIRTFHYVLTEKINDIVARDPSQNLFKGSWMARVDRMLKFT